MWVEVPDNLRRAAQILLILVGVLVGDVSLASAITVDVLRNAAYPSGFAPSGEIRLRAGEFDDVLARRGHLHVALTDHIAIGTLPDGTNAAAVVLRTTTGGNAAFHELTLMVEDARGVRWQATTPLGDRVLVDGIEIVRGEVVLRLREHAQDDPMCCPSLRRETRFAIRGTRLVARSMESR